jgi:hypothetical protein
MAMFSPHLHEYAHNMREHGGPYDLFWADVRDPKQRCSELGVPTLPEAAVRALEIASQEAHRGEVVAFSGDSWVWRAYQRSNGKGAIIGKPNSGAAYAQMQARALAGKTKRREDILPSGRGVPVDAWFVLSYKPEPGAPFLTAEYEGVVRALHAARLIAEKHAASHRVTVYISDRLGARLFAIVAGLGEPTVVRTVLPNRSKPKTILERIQARAAQPRPEPAAPPPPRYTYADEDDDEDEADAYQPAPLAETPPIIVPAPVPSQTPAGSADHAPQLNPHGGELPVPPFRPGQTHFLFSRAGETLIGKGTIDGEPVSMGVHKAALRVWPEPAERRMHREMYPTLDTYPWNAQGEVELL